MTKSITHYDQDYFRALPLSLSVGECGRGRCRGENVITNKWAKMLSDRGPEIII